MTGARAWLRVVCAGQKASPKGEEISVDIDIHELRSETRSKYSAVVETREAEFHFHTGRPLAALLGYDTEAVDGLPDTAVESFAAHLIHALESALIHDESPDRAYRLVLPLYAPTSAPRVETAALGARLVERWPDEEAPLRGEALAVIAHCSLFAGDNEAAQHHALAALAQPDATAIDRVIAHRVLALAAAMGNDRAAGLVHLEQAIDEGDALRGAFVRELRMSSAAMIDDIAQSNAALAVLDETAREAAARDETLTLAWAAVVRAHHHVLLEDLPSAALSADRALQLAEQTAAPWALCAAHRLLAALTTVAQGWDSAAPLWEEALDDVVVIGDVEGMAMTLRTAAGANSRAGRAELASRTGRARRPPLDDGAASAGDWRAAVAVRGGGRGARATAGSTHPVGFDHLGPGGSFDTGRVSR